jgi:hypothetical protein
MTQQRAVGERRERDVDPSRRYDGAADFPRRTAVVGVTKPLRGVRRSAMDGCVCYLHTRPPGQAPAFEIDRSRARDRAPNRPVKLRKKGETQRPNRTPPRPRVHTRLLLPPQDKTYVQVCVQTSLQTGNVCVHKPLKDVDNVSYVRFRERKCNPGRLHAGA